MGKMKEKNHIMSKWFIKIHKNKKYKLGNIVARKMKN